MWPILYCKTSLWNDIYVNRTWNVFCWLHREWWCFGFSKGVAGVLQKKLHHQKKTKTLKIGKRDKFTLSNYYEFLFQQSKKGEVKLPDFIGGLNKKTFQLATLTHQSCVSMPKNRAYKEKVSNPIKKTDDINEMFQYVPEEHVCFYDELIQWPTVEKEQERVLKRDWKLVLSIKWNLFWLCANRTN